LKDYGCIPHSIKHCFVAAVITILGVPIIATVGPR